jgi:hypothetical protein
MDYPDFIGSIAPIAQRYLTLRRVDPSRTYDYAARKMSKLPVFDVEEHAPRCAKGESWMYFAVPADANLQALNPTDLLYVGAQTQDRMFRGDGMLGRNFHHAQMRTGNGNGDTPVAFMASGRQIVIYRVASVRVRAMIEAIPSFSKLRILASQPRTNAKHLGWWYEQSAMEIHRWRWNTAGADKSVVRLLRA